MSALRGSGDIPASIDVIVLGMGPGGEDVAGRLAEAGLSVVGIDAGLVGGECPYWGCIPSKMMVRAAGLLADGRRIDKMAGHASVVADWAPVGARVADATDNWDDTVAVERFVSKGGHFVRGFGTIVGPKTVRVGDRALTANRALVIATGAVPVIPPIPGLSGTPYWTNREAIECDELPASLVVIGGGATGLELAQVFARFGVEVAVVEPSERVLGAEEPESSALAADALAADGVAILTGHDVEEVTWGEGSGFSARTAGGDTATGERLLVAAGRRPALEAIGAGTLGIDVTGRGIPVDARLHAAPGVWAIGDATGIASFTHLSMYHARIAAADILGQEPAGADHRALPRVTFLDPEVGSVGMTEHAARAAGLDVAVGTADVAKSARGWIHGPGGAGVVKLVVDRRRDVLVGATSVGPTGGEVLGLLVLAVHAQVPVPSLRSMIYAYPTFHRAIEDALNQLQGA